MNEQEATGILSDVHCISKLRIPRKRGWAGPMTGIAMWCLCFFHPALLWGARSVSMEVQWDYTPPPGKTVSSYQLYQGGLPVCRSTDTGGSTMECTIWKTVGDRSVTFTLDAQLSDGTRSALSAPYRVLLPPDVNMGPIKVLLLDDNS